MFINKKLDHDTEIKEYVYYLRSKHKEVTEALQYAIQLSGIELKGYRVEYQYSDTILTPAPITDYFYKVIFDNMDKPLPKNFENMINSELSLC